MKKDYFQIARHYEKCLEKHGDSHLGIDAPNEKDTYTRHKIMLEIIKDPNKKTSLLDFGCGASHCYEYLKKYPKYNKIKYSGLDISEKFIELSISKHPEIKYYCTDILKDDFAKKFDYIIMNGVCTEKLDLSFEEVWDFLKALLKKIWPLCNKGMAFNVMSKHVDWERDDLFHLPLDVLADFLTKSISRNYIIRNDYGLYEYTTYVYKKPHK